jgi:hypothetical protein
MEMMYQQSQMSIHQEDDAEKGLSGAVKTLELRNFMPHKHKIAKFGRNVNFIVGVSELERVRVCVCVLGGGGGSPPALSRSLSSLSKPRENNTF